MDHYGEDHEALAAYIGGYDHKEPSVELTEVFRADRGRRDTYRNDRSKFEVRRQCYSQADTLRAHICQKSPPNQVLRILCVSQLSSALIKLLGSKYEMDYELWTSHFQSSAREWFAGPLIDRGPRQFSHFNLSFVDFQRATHRTPPEFQSNRKISHTIRLMRLLDVKPEVNSGNGSSAGDATAPGPRVFVIRRISGHIRQDQNLWTFIYFCSPYVNLEGAHYVSDIPGKAQKHLSTWITEFVHELSSMELLDDFTTDGFGFVLKVLREIKTTWKLLLNELEIFLEDMNEQFEDDELVDSATWLHRQFIMNLDYFQRQLLYQQRYVTYLVNAPTQDGLCIVPSTFAKDLLQEQNGFSVADQRLTALRNRTSAILDTVVNLNAFKQAKLAHEMTQLQHKDATLTFSQGQSIRRLTILNMVYLPSTFIATVYGMNVFDFKEGHHSLGIVSFAMISVVLTAFTLAFAIFKLETVFANVWPPNKLPSNRGGQAMETAVQVNNRTPSSHPSMPHVLWQWFRSLRVVRVRVEEKPAKYSA